MIPFSSGRPSSSCCSSGGGAGVLVKVGAGSLGGLRRKELLLQFSSVVFPSDAQYIVLCTAIPRVSSCQWFALYSSCHQIILGEVVNGVGLSLDVCALGFVMLSKVLVRLGVGAIVLDDADPYVELDGQRVFLSFSGEAFCSRVRFVILSVTAQCISCT